MGLMAVFALHANDLYMEVMLTRLRDGLMAIQAISPVRPYSYVWFMTFITLKLHWCISRDI